MVWAGFNGIPLITFLFKAAIIKIWQIYHLLSCTLNCNQSNDMYVEVDHIFMLLPHYLLKYSYFCLCTLLSTLNYWKPNHCFFQKTVMAINSTFTVFIIIMIVHSSLWYTTYCYIIPCIHTFVCQGERECSVVVQMSRR